GAAEGGVKKEEALKSEELLEDDAELLYGVGGLDALPAGAKRGRDEAAAAPAPAGDPVSGARRVATHLCALCRGWGALEIYALPDFALLFNAPLFARGPQLVLHASAEGPRGGAALADPNPVVEICLSALGTLRGWPYLAALLKSGDLFVYESF